MTTEGTTPDQATTTTPVTSTTTTENTLPEWMGTLPEDVKTMYGQEKSITRFKDIPSLLASYKSAQSMIGGDKIAVPKQGSDPKEWQDVFTKLGRPESPDKYEVKVEGADENFLKGYKTIAHEAGLLPSQVQKIADWYQKANGDMAKALETQKQTKITEHAEAIKKEWGEGYDRKFAQASAAASEFFSEETIKLFNESGVFANPTFLKDMAKRGEGIKEDSLPGSNGGAMGLTPSELDDKIKETEAELFSLDRNSPRRQILMKQRDQLYQKMFPGGLTSTA